MKYTALMLLGALAALILAVAHKAPDGVMHMSQAERKAAAIARDAAEQQARNTRSAQQLCALRLGIPYNEAWLVEAKADKYIVQRGMCRIARELVE